MKLVLDTNVLIAAFVARGACRELLEHCERRHEVIGSAFLLDEFERTLVRKFQVPPLAARLARGLLEGHMTTMAPASLEAPVSRDPDDDQVLGTALAGNCECLVTGDHDLLILEEFRGIRILTPAAWWSYEAKRESTS